LLAQNAENLNVTAGCSDAQWRQVTGRINILRWRLKLNISSAIKLLKAFDLVLCSPFSWDYLT